MSEKLNEACRYNDKAKVQELLKSVKRRDKINETYVGNTVLYIASEYASADVVAVLLQHGASPHIRSACGNELPLHAACWSDIDDTRKCELLLGQNNLYLNEPQDCGYIDKLPISIAAACGNVDLVALFLQRGADYNISGDDQGGGPLQAAASSGRVNAIELLLKHDSCIINTSCAIYRDNKEVITGTALNAAAYYGEVEAVRALASRSDCDITVHDSKGRTALDTATAKINMQHPGIENKDGEYSSIIEYLACLESAITS